MMSAYLYYTYFATCAYDVLLTVWYDVFPSVCHPICIMSACENVSFLTSSENLAFLTVLAKILPLSRISRQFSLRETRKSRKFYLAELSRKSWNDFRRKLKLRAFFEFSSKNTDEITIYTHETLHMNLPPDRRSAQFKRTPYMLYIFMFSQKFERSEWRPGKEKCHIY